MMHLRRRTIKNFTDILILIGLRKQPMSGYEVIRSIYQRFNILPCSGSVYSLLSILEANGLIKGEWHERSKIYSLTSKGEEMVDASLAFSGRLERLLTRMFTSGFQ